MQYSRDRIENKKSVIIGGLLLVLKFFIITRKEKFVSEKTEQQEIWKQYPDYSFIEVSNLGRVRTKDRYVPGKDGRKCFYKGRVLKQRLSNSGYMQVKFGVNGKYVFLYVHRMVATCYVPNPLGLPQVNHIDNNRTNNSASNLEWCTPQYNNDYKKNFGTSPAQLFGHLVFAVNLKTGKVLRFESQAEATRQLGISESNISEIIKGKRYKTAGGYWFTEDEGEITEKKIREIRASMKSCQVIAVNPETSEVFWFDSQSEAAQQLGFDGSHIAKVVKGKQNKTHGW